MVGGSGLLVVVAEAHPHRDLPTAEVLGELATDFVPIDLAVEVGTSEMPNSAVSPISTWGPK